MLAVLVEEERVDRSFLAERARDGQMLFDALADVPIADYCTRAGVAEADVRRAARLIGGAGSVSVVEDLGIEMAPHSTLNSYLEKLLYVLTGNLGRPGAMNLGTHLGKLIGSSRDNRVSPVGRHRIITGLIPCNAIPGEILTAHPDRFRAALIESGNPAHSLADSPRMREALDALELVVVIDVAMTDGSQEIVLASRKGMAVRVSEEDVRAKGWPALFAGDVAPGRPLVVEIGFGRGEFLLELAAAAPGSPHLGVEYSAKRVLKMARRVARSPVRNLRLLASRPPNLGYSYPPNQVWRHWALARHGRLDTLLQEYESEWATMPAVAQNNTMPEHWNHRPDSPDQFSHAAVAPLLALLMEACGIRPLEPGFKTTEIQPQLAPLQHVELVVHTPHGPIRFSDTATGPQSRDLRLDLPPGITATLKLPRQTIPNLQGHHRQSYSA